MEPQLEAQGKPMMPGEQAITFGCEGETLCGVLHPSGSEPRPASATTGVVVIVGGPQYRAGSHRQFVHMARELAHAGHPVLRFDVRGMGDSTGALRSFEHLTPDVGAAIDALQRHAPGVQRVALWGLCDGASAALLYLNERRDPRVVGLCLLNPWVRSEASLARTHVKHYYTQRVLQRAFWVKLLSGRVAGAALRGLLDNLRQARGAPAPKDDRPFQTHMADAWRAFRGHILLVLSGDDYTAREFVEFTAADPDWRGLLQRPSVQRHELPAADHTLSTAAHKTQMNSITLRWLSGLA